MFPSKINGGLFHVRAFCQILLLGTGTIGFQREISSFFIERHLKDQLYGIFYSESHSYLHILSEYKSIHIAHKDLDDESFEQRYRNNIVEVFPSLRVHAENELLHELAWPWWKRMFPSYFDRNWK